MPKRSLPSGEGGAAKKRKLQGGLSLEQFASAKASGFDKKHERDKQRALNAKQVNALRRRLSLAQAAFINLVAKFAGGSDQRLLMWPMSMQASFCGHADVHQQGFGSVCSANIDAGEQVSQAQTEATADGQAKPQSPCRAPGEVLVIALLLPQACCCCSQEPGAGAARHKRTTLTV